MLGARELWGKYRNNASRLTMLLHQYYARSGLFAGKTEDVSFLEDCRWREIEKLKSKKLRIFEWGVASV